MMDKIKIGDIVGRKSYNKDIIFIVKDISDIKNVLLEGVFERIIADSDISDLERIDKKEFSIKEAIKEMELKKLDNRLEENMITGKILHLDGDSCLDNKNSHWLKILNLKKKYLTTNKIVIFIKVL